LLTESEVSRSWTKLFKSGIFTEVSFEKAEALLEELRPTSPLRHRLTSELEELRQIHGADVTGWRWGNAHEARFGPTLLQRIPVVGTLFDVALPTDGGQYTLNRGAMRVSSSTAPYRNIHGAGLRAIYDLADLDRSQFMIAIGQSGNPLSRHFSDLAQPWRDFEWRSLPRLPVGDTLVRFMLVPQ